MWIFFVALIPRIYRRQDLFILYDTFCPAAGGLYKFFNFSFNYSKENDLYIHVMRVSWPRRSQRSGEIDAVEGIALRKVGVRVAS